MTDNQRHQRLYIVDAIVLDGLDFKEADRILTLFTREQGKIGVIAKGIRKPTSRMGYGLDHLSQSRLMLAKGRDLDVVTSVDLVDAHLGLAGDVTAYAYASHFAELVNRLTQERQANVAVFDLLANALQAVSTGVDPFAVARYFELALLSLMGYRPELYRCVVCGRDLQPVVNALSPRLGGMLCPACQIEDRAALPLSVNAQKYLRLLDRSGLAEAVKRSPSDALRRELELAMLAYARQYTERDLTSLAVLRAIEAQDDRAESPAAEG